jgi:hypothetical protein
MFMDPLEGVNESRKLTARSGRAALPQEHKRDTNLPKKSTQLGCGLC